MLGVESLKLLAVKKLRKQFERDQVEVEAYPAIIRGFILPLVRAISIFERRWLCLRGNMWKR